MKSYLMSGENYTMHCSEQDLISNLIETYTYYFKQAHDLQEKLYESCGESEEYTKVEEDAYQLGILDGEIDALSTIMLSVLGGGNTYDIWQKTMEWVSK